MTTTLRYPGDAQSRREQEERHRIASERYRAEQVKRERIEAARPKPPTWWNELTPKMRRGVIYGMHADGHSYSEIAKHLTLSPTRVRDLFLQTERRMFKAADIRFARRRDWHGYRAPARPIESLKERTPRSSARELLRAMVEIYGDVQKFIKLSGIKSGYPLGSAIVEEARALLARIDAASEPRQPR